MRILSVNHLYNLLLTCVDMKVNNITVVSQTTRGEISFNDRILKYNPNGFTLVHKGEIKFDPLNNFKQSQILFSVFLQLQEEDGELYTKMIYDERNPEEKTRIVVKTDTNIITSNYYYNISLGYIELILTLSGIMVENLFELDSAPPDVEEKKIRRQPLFPQRDLF